MDLKSLKDLMRFVEKSQFVEFEYKDDEMHIILKKKEAFIGDSIVAQAPQPVVVETSVQKQQLTDKGVEEKKENNEKRLEGLVEIRSPMVATFYRASSPTSPPYVEVGDEVKKGATLCILEAMKIMNELEAEFPCKIEQILVENGQKVEFDQPLFLVKRLD